MIKPVMEFGTVEEFNYDTWKWELLPGKSLRQQAMSKRLFIQNWRRNRKGRK